MAEKEAVTYDGFITQFTNVPLDTSFTVGCEPVFRSAGPPSSPLGKERR